MAGSNAKYFQLSGSRRGMSPPGTRGSAEAVFGRHTGGVDGRPRGSRAQSEKAWLQLFKKPPSCPPEQLCQQQVTFAGFTSSPAFGACRPSLL